MIIGNTLREAESRHYSVQLAKKVGDRQATILQQLHFWLTRSKYRVHTDGDHRLWLQRSVAEWHETDFPYWSKRTIERLLSDLESKGLIIAKHKVGRGDPQVKWFTIEYTHALFAAVYVDATMDPAEVPRELRYLYADTDTHRGGSEPTPDKMSVVPTTKCGGTHDKMAVTSYIEDQKDHSKGSTPKVADVITDSVFDREEELSRVRANPSHGPTLSRFWRRCMSEFGHTTATQPEMKIKEQKMLKDILRLLPEGGEVMLLNVLEHYALFVKHTREDYNVTLAARPEVKKLLLVIDGITEFNGIAGMHDDEIDYDNLGLKGLFDDHTTTTGIS